MPIGFGQSGRPALAALVGGAAILAAVAAIGSCAHTGAGAPAGKTAAGGIAGELPRFCTREECGVVLAHNAETEDCECEARRLDESLGARLDLVFAVPPGGGVAEVAVGRAISMPEPLERCVLTHAASWSFPAAGTGGSRFRAGIIFAPDDAGACARPTAALSHQARIDKEQARLALLGQQAEVKACFEQTLGKATPAEGRAVVTVLVNRDGRVIQAEIDGTSLPDRKIADCIVEKAFGWQLPRPHPPGVVTLTYPYTVGPGG